MRFAWNERKAASNRLKHGITFEEAATVVGDPLSDTFPDDDHSLDEQRFIIIGASESGKILCGGSYGRWRVTAYQRP
jgi:uncharacterized DUF497 family protein